MIFKIFSDAISTILSALSFIFPTAPEPLGYGTILSDIGLYVQPFAYSFALDQLLVALVPLFAWAIFLGLTKVVYFMKLYSKWW